MIDVSNGKDLGYDNDRPVVSIEQQLSLEACRNLLPLLVKSLGADTVKAELDKHITAVEKGEYEVRDTAGRFATRDIAGESANGVFEYRNHAEAAALISARATGLDTYVLKRVAVARCQTVPATPTYETVLTPIK